MAKKSKEDIDLVAVEKVKIVTVPALPGMGPYMGLVTGTGTASGRTAWDKQANAHVDAILELKKAAWRIGANAIVGMSTSHFVASAGGMLGDAVGVHLSGTAVVLSQDG